MEENVNNKYKPLLVKLVKGKLSEIDRKVLDDKASNDADFEEWMMEELVIIQALNEWSQKEESKIKNPDNNKFNRKYKLKTIQRIAAILVISFAFIGGFWMYLKSSQSIVDEYYVFDEGVIRSPNLPDPFNSVKFVLSDRVENQYSTIDSVLRTVGPLSPNYEEAQYYLGHLLFIKKDYVKSKEIFLSLNDSDYFNDKSNWFAALCMLALKDNERAKKNLNNLLKVDNYKSRSKEILEKIK